MPNGLNNWCERDVVDFLKEKGFTFHEMRKGSHYAYINKTTGHIVEINIPKDAFVPRTLETMIRQSGLLKKIGEIGLVNNFSRTYWIHVLLAISIKQVRCASSKAPFVLSLRADAFE